MGAMTTGQAATQPTGLPYGRPLTVADLGQMPDDGHRYELIDGVLIVTPAPSFAHQIIVTAVWQVLQEARPEESDICVLVAPFDVVLADNTAIEPDVLVARRADFTEHNLPTAPLLAVEVLSPSTRMIDLNVKRERFERAGVPSHWAIDPNGPRLIAWELRDGAYVEVADVSGDQSWTAEQPYRVTVVPSRLLD